VACSCRYKLDWEKRCAEADEDDIGGTDRQVDETRRVEAKALGSVPERLRCGVQVRGLQFVAEHEFTIALAAEQSDAWYAIQYLHS
jgi:hypothetical protein